MHMQHDRVNFTPGSSEIVGRSDPYRTSSVDTFGLASCGGINMPPLFPFALPLLASSAGFVDFFIGLICHGAGEAGENDFVK